VEEGPEYVEREAFATKTEGGSLGGAGVDEGRVRGEGTGGLRAREREREKRAVAADGDNKFCCWWLFALTEGIFCSLTC